MANWNQHPPRRPHGSHRIHNRNAAPAVPAAPIATPAQPALPADPVDRADIGQTCPAPPPTRAQVAQAAAGQPTALDTVVSTAEDVGKAITQPQTVGHVAGNMGGYDATMDSGRVQMTPQQSLSPDLKEGLKGHVGVRLEANLAGTVLQQTVPRGGWTDTHGIRAGVKGTYDLHADKLVTGKYDGQEALSSAHVEARQEAFETFKKKLTPNDTLTLGGTVGAAQDILHPSVTTYAEGVQELRHNLSADLPFTGPDTSLTLRAREGVRADLTHHQSSACYEGYAGVSKKLPVNVLGQHSVTVGLGVVVDGNREHDVAARPDVGLGVEF